MSRLAAAVRRRILYADAYSAKNDQASDEFLICPLATFGHASYGDLPNMLQHFVLPVGKSTEIPKGSRSLRTEPAWPDRCQWTLAWMYTRHQDNLIAWGSALDKRWKVIAEDVSGHLPRE